MNDDIIFSFLVLYVLVLPFITNLMWQENEQSNQSFIQFYFSKSERVNWLGFLIFLLACSGYFIWYIIFKILELVVMFIILPIMWIFEFLFLNKDCSNINNKEPQNKLNGENNDKIRN